MSGQIHFDTIRVVSASRRDDGGKAVIIKHERDGELIFASSLPPAHARQIAADLLECAEYCEAAEKQATDAAQALIAKLQAEQGEG